MEDNKYESFSEKELQQAAKEVERAMLADLPSPAECEQHVFSLNFEEQMNMLLRRQQMRSKWRKRLQRVACALLMLLLGMSISIAADQQARAGFISWIEETFEDAIVLFSGHQDNTCLEEVPSCRFTWLPENYWVDDCRFDSDAHKRFTAVLRADGKEDTFFCCEINDKNWTLSLDYDENYQIQRVTVGKCLGELYISEDGNRPNSIVWQEENGDIVIYLTGFLTGSDLQKVAEGVVLDYSER